MKKLIIAEKPSVAKTLRMPPLLPGGMDILKGRII